MSGERVFISSTYLDNRRRRQVVEEAVIGAGMVPVGMEHFTASARPTVEDCETQVAGCDVYLGIVAHRYGWIPEGRDLSITELEYDAAARAGRDRLMFEIEDDVLVSPNGDFDPGPDRWSKQEKPRALSREVSSGSAPRAIPRTTRSGNASAGRCVLGAISSRGARRSRRRPRRSPTPRRPRTSWSATGGPSSRSTAS